MEYAEELLELVTGGPNDRAKGYIGDIEFFEERKNSFPDEQMEKIFDYICDMEEHWEKEKPVYDKDMQNAIYYKDYFLIETALAIGFVYGNSKSEAKREKLYKLAERFYDRALAYKGKPEEPWECGKI